MSVTRDPKDVEANYFAAELLMPRKLIIKALGENPNHTAGTLAKLFNVDEVDMTRRLIYLRLP